jgi:hypothetical protein
MHFRHWKRREFITLLSGTAVALWPLAAHAQQAAKLPTIGFLGANNASFERGSTDAFVSIQHTVRYTELAPTRFKHLFRD